MVDCQKVVTRRDLVTVVDCQKVVTRRDSYSGRLSEGSYSGRLSEGSYSGRLSEGSYSGRLSEGSYSGRLSEGSYHSYSGRNLLVSLYSALSFAQGMFEDTGPLNGYQVWLGNLCIIYVYQ